MFTVGPGLEVVAMIIGPPLIGYFLGFLLGTPHKRPVRGGIGGLIGGTIGAWIGVGVYRAAVLPGAANLISFVSIVFNGFLLGAVPAAWCAARSASEP